MGFGLDTRKAVEIGSNCCLLSTGGDREIDKQVDRYFKIMISVIQETATEYLFYAKHYSKRR